MNNTARLVLLLSLSLIIGVSNAQVLINSSTYANWYIYNYSAYQQNATNINNVIKIFNNVVPQLQKDFGNNITPINININSNGCCGGLSGGGVEGLNIGDFNSISFLCSPWLTPENWTKGVAIGEFVNTFTGDIANGWPRDWWADDVWYFPGISAIRGLSEAGYGTISTQWSATAAGSCTSYNSHPIYNIFNNVISNQGWAPFKAAFSNMTADGFDNYDNLQYPNGTHVANPSELRSEYAIAFLSLGANVSSTFVSDLNNNGNMSYKINQEVVNKIVAAIKGIQLGREGGFSMQAAESELDSGNYTAAFASAEFEMETSTTTSSTTTSTTSTTTVQTTSLTTLTTSILTKNSSPARPKEVTSVEANATTQQQTKGIGNYLIVGFAIIVALVILILILKMRSAR